MSMNLTVTEKESLWAYLINVEIDISIWDDISIIIYSMCLVLKSQEYTPAIQNIRWENGWKKETIEEMIFHTVELVRLSPYSLQALKGRW